MTQRKVRIGRGYFLVEVDPDGFALDPDYRPNLAPSAKVTDAATCTRRGRVVGLDGWTTNRPELHAPALWIEWADTGEREHLTDLSGLVSCQGRSAESCRALYTPPSWAAVYDERRRARASLLDEPDGEAGPGPIGRAAWRDGAPFTVTRETWSPDFDAYAAGELRADQVRCVECGAAPCACHTCAACRAWRVAPGVACPRCGAVDPS